MLTYSDAAALAEAEKNGEDLLPGKLSDSALQCHLREILKATASPRKSIGPANGVVVDGWVLPKAAPAEVFATGREHRVPLLAGNNVRERTPPPTTPEDLTKAMAAMYGPLAPFEPLPLTQRLIRFYGRWGRAMGSGYHVPLSRGG